MTDLQKKKIMAMRQQNAPYVAISETLGIPVGTIKSFCRRNLEPTEGPRAKPCCKNCGSELTNTPKTKNRLFCSDQCRQTWWNKHRYERTSTRIVTHTCALCGKVFVDYSGANRKFCCQECYRERGVRDGQ